MALVIRYRNVLGRTAAYLVSMYFIGEMLIFLFQTLISLLPSRNCVMEECHLMSWHRAPEVVLAVSVATLFGVLAFGVLKDRTWSLYASAGLFAVQLIHVVKDQFRYGVQVGNGFSLPVIQDMTPIGPNFFELNATCCLSGNGEHAVSVNLVALVGLITLALVGISRKLESRNSAG